MQFLEQALPAFATAQLRHCGYSFHALISRTPNLCGIYLCLDKIDGLRKVSYKPNPAVHRLIAKDSIDVEARDVIAPIEGIKSDVAKPGLVIEEGTLTPVAKPVNNTVDKTAEESINDGQTVPEGMFVVIGGVFVVILMTVVVPFAYFKCLRKASPPGKVGKDCGTKLITFVIQFKSHRCELQHFQTFNNFRSIQAFDGRIKTSGRYTSALQVPS